jgi:hypothetical protein
MAATGGFWSCGHRSVPDFDLITSAVANAVMIAEWRN